jgi:hypothetical protein
MAGVCANCKVAKLKVCEPCGLCEEGECVLDSKKPGKKKQQGGIE